MPSLLKIGALFAAVSAVFAHPTAPDTSKRQVTAFGMGGAAEGGIQTRLEIRDLVLDADLFNIYLLAIQSFKAMDPDDPMSWYRIAAIHGQPWTYNDVGPCEGCDVGPPYYGYCTHSSTLFPTWHRAYIALFEQSLQQNAIEVANQFTGDEQTKYVDAARRLRAPFWDFAWISDDETEALPIQFTQETVDVITPDGQQTIENPLLRYDFNGADNSFTKDPSAGTTVRSPTISLDIRRQLRSNLYTLLTSQDNFNEFSTRALPGQRKNPSNLESLHDSVHGSIGGDMGEPNSAGFDPIFWLHHAMVDRVLTLYQAAWPETWLEDVAEVGQTFTYQAQSTQGSTSNLSPFYASSDAVRDTTVYNYNYADLATGQSPADIINGFYSSGSTGSWQDMRKRDSDGSSSSNTTLSNQYIVRVEVDLPGTEGSFDLFIFDGPVDKTSPENWYKDTDFLGEQGFFTNPQVHGNKDQISVAAVTITDVLQRRVDSGDLQDLDPATVERYIRDNMKWRVVDRNNQEVHRSAISMLQINVLTAEVQHGPAGTMPSWGAMGQLVGCADEVGAWINSGFGGAGWCNSLD